MGKGIFYFSARILQPQTSGGIVGYFLGLVEALAKYEDMEIHVGLNAQNYQEFGAQLPREVVRHQLTGLTNEFAAASERELIDQLAPLWVVYTYPDRQDFYETPRSFRVATCLPDLQHLAHPFFFSPAERDRRDIAFGAAVRSADLIFTLSDFVRQDVMRAYGCGEERVKVVYPSASPRFLKGRASQQAIHDVAKKHGLPEKYAIFPGNAWSHKNHRALLESLSMLRERGVHVPLVLVGDTSSADAKLRRQMETPKAEGWLINLGYVSSEELHALISGASCLLFPSLFEGFGIPVAEALAVGVPVACSNVCSLPEVGGTVAHYFDPGDVESIAKVVEEVWNGDCEQTRQDGPSHAARFNYHDSAQTLRAALLQAPAHSEQITVNEPPLVSIVTPSYQQGRFLRQCIDSVLTQDYPHIEYCVMDGGSTDESCDILRSYNGRFFWKSERDGGQTNAINAGLKLSKGNILAYLNSDDILLPGAISQVVQEWERRPSMDLLYGRANYIDEHGKVLREYETREFQIKDFRGRCYICQPAAFWHRRTMEKFGLLDEEFQMAMDYEYWQRIAANNGLIVRIDKLLACSREYSDTKTLSQREKVFEDIFRSQWLHWGIVHRNWWACRLSYMRYEKRHLWMKLIPKSKHWPLAEFLENIRREWPYWNKPFRIFRKKRKRAVKESGYLPSGEVSPSFTLPMTLERPSTIYLSGVSPEQKELKITFGPCHETLSEIVKAEKGTEFCFRKELQPGRYLLQIACSASEIANSERPVGFHIKSTNIFSFRPN